MDFEKPERTNPVKTDIELIDLTELLPHTIASGVEYLWWAGVDGDDSEIDNLKTAKYYLSHSLCTRFLFQTESTSYGHHEIITEHDELVRFLIKCILRCNRGTYHKIFQYLFTIGSSISMECIEGCLKKIDA